MLGIHAPLFGSFAAVTGGGMQFRKQRSKRTIDAKQQNSFTKYKVDDSLEANVKMLKQIFNDDDTLVVRHFENRQQRPVKCCIAFIDGMVNSEIINENVIQAIMQNTILKNHSNDINDLQNNVIITGNIEKTTNVGELINAIVRGDTAFFLNGSSEGLIISTKGWHSRAISEPQTEKVIRGPREGFNESILMNLTMIRRKLTTPNLKIKFMTMGVQTHTKIGVCYIEGIVNRKILEEVYKRLNRINIDGVLDSGYIQELIKDSPFSLMKTIGSTERPDVVAGKLLEGRIAIAVDGTPVVLTVPHLFIENFQANEDYYTNFYYSSIGRLVRIISFVITVSVPAIYTALVTFHQETIPRPLLLSISSARQGIPFPTIVEIIMLLFIFEMLLVAGMRMPSNIGQALSIVGALVLGQAAVEARIVSAPIIIVVSVTAISGLILPKIGGAVFILRGILLLLATIVGLYGYLFGIMGLLLHLCELRSFGVPYLLCLTEYNFNDLKDTAIRAPWWYMNHRPKLLTSNSVRQTGGGNNQ